MGRVHVEHRESKNAPSLSRRETGGHSDDPGIRPGVWDIYAGNADSLDTGASHLLTWELIIWALKQGYRFYDLGGVVPKLEPIGPWSGLKLFKSGFGGAEVEFVGEYDLVFDPIIYRFWHWGYRAFQQLVRLKKSRLT